MVSYRIYRKSNNGEMQLYKTIQKMEFVDKEISPGGVYNYQVVAVFAKGAISSMGKAIEVKSRFYTYGRQISRDAMTIRFVA